MRMMFSFDDVPGRSPGYSDLNYWVRLVIPI